MILYQVRGSQIMILYQVRGITFYQMPISACILSTAVRWTLT